MNVDFEPIYLANRHRDLFTRWTTVVSLSCDDVDGTFNHSCIVLPPRHRKLTMTIEFDLDDGELAIESLLQEVVAALSRSQAFWHDLNYTPHFATVSDRQSVQISLECHVFTNMKTKSLLEQPLSILKHTDVRLFTVAALHIHADLLGRSVAAGDVVRHCNEYIVSLFMSQLEFQFPLAFSRTCRQRFLQQEAYLGSISYALTNSATMIPKLVKLISNDKTATMCYRLLQLASDRRKVARLAKFDSGVSPFQVLKRS
ncbi:LADA_0E01794g1_1 [Lachancea dasiensis]|uniref:LADA_0E01794g1_1 n=1 Tax=Lachancea dasiensis TaxID=1072105 RepID=A0A1G4JAN4_9SACH|nr:LADA_0E01794g1_1 [Lachancea dasiensis]